MVFNSEPPGGYYLLNSDVATNDQSNAHVFCGPNNVIGAYCPNCEKPLLQLLSLNTTDYRLYLKDSAFHRLSLLFCWTCELSQSLFSYVHRDDGSIEILGYRKGETYDDFPYKDYPSFFPGAVATLEAIPHEDQDVIKALNRDTISEWEINKTRPDLCMPRHQVGGEPFLVQRNLEEQVRCFICTRHMPFLAAIGNDGIAGTRFTTNDFVQVLFHYCRRCSVVAAYQRAD